MTLATMTDRTLPLAERVKEAVRSGMNAQAGDERFLPVLDALDGLDGLLDDIAAADRLARAASAWSFTRDAALDRLYAAPDPIRGTVAGDDEADSEAAYREYEDAFDAYRARMAQGVGA